jgi:hypothetical protein
MSHSPFSFLPQSSLEAIALAALDNLGKREARKLMGGLKLQQKRNGVELSTELMIASIRREFKVSPERVIEVIRSRLPELLPNATARQEQLVHSKLIFSSFATRLSDQALKG